MWLFFSWGGCDDGDEMRIISAALLTAVLCAGCATATSGREFRVENVGQLRPGQTTISQARALLGEPYQVVEASSGNRLYIWQHVESRARGTSVNTDLQQLVVLFDSEARMVRPCSWAT